MENTIKTLIVKQHLDPTGPRQSFQWQPGLDLAVLNEFKGKTSSWETFSYFESDLLIIPTALVAGWLDSLVKKEGYVEALESTTQDVRKPLEFDFSKYDLVISHDPILAPYLNEIKPKAPKTVFAYLLAEHTTWQLHGHSLDYDLFLDHTNNSVDKMVRLPQSMNFIYPRVPDKLDKLFKTDNTNVFFDYRSVGKLLKGSDNVGITLDEFKSFKDNLDINLPIEDLSELSLQPFMFTLTSDSDAVDYYSKLCRSKYFITVANRIGQAAFDAASAGALVIGNKQSELHNKICHSSCLMEGNFTTEDVINKIKSLENDPSKFVKALLHQSKALDTICVEQPKKLLKQAIKLKHESIL